ncbi:glutathione S-transferase [soil metagenome]
MIIVHHLNNSRSQRLLWLLEELGAPYEIKKYERNTETMLAPPELRAIHPLGKSPVIEDDGVVVAETGAIIEDILSKYPGNALTPAAGTEAARRLTYWLHYAEGSAMTPLLLKLVFGALPKRAPGLIRPIVNAVSAKAQSGFIDPQIVTHTAYWESELTRAPWFAGDRFSAADIMMSFPVEAAAARSPYGADKPKLKSWLQTIHARPAYQRALERGGPYAYA